jgi:hypothetical protein
MAGMNIDQLNTVLTIKELYDGLFIVISEQKEWNFNFKSCKDFSTKGNLQYRPLTL